MFFHRYILFPAFKWHLLAHPVSEWSVPVYILYIIISYVLSASKLLAYFPNWSNKIKREKNYFWLTQYILNYIQVTKLFNLPSYIHICLYQMWNMVCTGCPRSLVLTYIATCLVKIGNKYFFNKVFVFSFVKDWENSTQHGERFLL